MPYDRLPRRLREDVAPALSTMPDGSVDRYATLSAGALRRFEKRETFGREVRAGTHKAFHIRPETTEPGGQCVNTAQQAAALGARVTCYGHLDHAVFDDLPFETVSMGQPATVNVFEFDDGDVLLVEASPDIDAWTLADLRAAADLREVFAADAVCAANWASVPGLGPAFHGLADADLPRVPFVFDPGDLVGSDPAGLRDLLGALAALQETFDVVFNANRSEIRATAAALPAPPADDADRVAAIREETGVSAVVMHAEAAAVAATGSGVVSVPNLAADDPARHTGGGDRFSAGLGYGLALGWDWDLALALGNACAISYVRTGETHDAESLAAFLEEEPGPRE